MSNSPSAGRGSPPSTAVSISAIGVIPAMGSRGKVPREYETAPMSRPSTYTGLPLMPCITPVVARGPPSSFARIRSRPGATTFLSTPMMCARNSSSWVPAYTVRPMPTMPGRMSDTGMNEVCAPGAARASTARAGSTRARIRRRDEGCCTGVLIGYNTRQVDALDGRLVRSGPYESWRTCQSPSSAPRPRPSGRIGGGTPQELWRATRADSCKTRRDSGRPLQ